MKKRVSVFFNGPTSLTYFDGKTPVTGNLRHVDLALEQIKTCLEEGHKVTELMNDFSEEPLTLENYADDRMFEAVLARRERELELKEQHQDYEKQVYRNLQKQRSTLTFEQFKQKEKEMYDELQVKRNETASQIQYLHDHTRGVPFDESADENIV